MKKSFGSLYLRMFYRPSSTFDNIFDSGHTLKYAFFASLVPAIGYTLFYIMAWYSGGSPSTFKPWLALPVEEYFKYDIILTLPGYFLSWIGASGVVYLICSALKGDAKYDNILAVIGFGIGVATWSSMFHDLTDAILSVLGIIDMQEYEALLNEPTFWRGLLWTLYAIYFSWILTLFTLGIKKATGLNLFKSIIVSFIALCTFQTILLIFIR
ncbi:MAG: YIP1 family protein [Bacteroidales bacterium]